MNRAIGCAVLAGLACATPGHAQQRPAGGARMTAAELFAFADAARDAGRYEDAEAAYRALAADPDPELRTEARFRLGMMLADRQHKYRDAAIEFRRILDDKPGAARVRLELARMDALLGNVGAAQKELRAAQASGLPKEVDQLVRFYAAALNARKPIGFSVEGGIAPDSNINRATKSETLGTIIGDFSLDSSARARSGVGGWLRGQAYWRKPIDRRVNLLVRASASGTLYRASEFDDIATSLEVGPELSLGADRFSIAFGPGQRWYGLHPYSFTLGGSANWQHPLGKRAQLRIDGAAASVDNKLNDLQDGGSYALAVSIDRSLSARFGGGIQLSGTREAARDPGYATASGGFNAYFFREMGRTTAVVTAGYTHLEADARLFLYPERRRDDRFSASLSGTFRSIRIGAFAPLARLRWERNKSTLELYDYSRISAEFGIAAAF
ncbi:surface lipoprotein assembly modifier [Sphingomonas sp. KR3-1]|uniref:surface lipoprotein assembly modifier n=1 Tax=Sphingomonas sp. KR3-1 TaxID=3156611 RepID=UPI0032B32DAE